MLEAEATKKTSKKSGIMQFTVLLSYLLFVNALDSNIPIIKNFYLPEFLLLFILGAICWSQVKRKNILYVGEYIIIGAFGLLVFIGLIGNLLFDYQNINMIFFDCLNLVEFIIAYFYGRFLFKKESVDELMVYLQRYFRVVSIAMFAMLLSNLVFHFWDSYDYRFGYSVQSLFFSHATYLTSFSVFSLLFFSFNWKKGDSLYIVMNSIIIIAAARNKGLIFLGVYIGIVVLLKFGKKVNLFSIFGIGSLLYILFQNSISERLLSTETAARSLLYQQGLKLSIRFFPIGSGFGTYGSSASGMNYSKLYGEIGFNQLFGFSNEHGKYLTDSFFAMILGQFGFTGLFLIGLIFMTFFKLAFWNPKYKQFVLLLFIYMALSMVTENFISSTYGTIAFMLIGMISVRENEQKGEEEIT
ncbi:hypothetical protein RAK27_11320 [Carnobacterium maltaromaticum]|uniref:Uncharacterized protein n=1 Tax=Carnobacterium maltaromaticum TaxID=2751 RepID=A0AAW9K0I6_CARML|nr:hypothetical protein [Carnobacterium maltaromaticum]MDZ5759251.1 hypothetical protein [Carnobacterium maltaromaticum]